MGRMWVYGGGVVMLVAGFFWGEVGCKRSVEPTGGASTATAAAAIPAKSSVSQSQRSEFGAFIYTAENLPQRLDIALDKGRMWQTLPRKVVGSCNGLDGKVWLEVEPLDWKVSLEAARALIQREWGEAMPQMSLVRPVLFEPGGRVWFEVPQMSYTGGGVALIGYDGKTFVEYSPPGRVFFSNRAAGVGKMGGSACVYADNHAFFATRDSICVFDGKDWSVRAMAEGGPLYAESPCCLYVEPDGKGVVRVSQDASGSIFRWRSGEWKKLATGIVNDVSAQEKVPVLGAVALKTEVWLLTGEGMKSVSYEVPAASPRKTVAELIELVEGGNAEAAEAASRELVPHGRRGMAAVQKAALASEDPAMRKKLLGIAEHMTSWPSPQQTVLGKFVLSSVTGVGRLGDGRAMVAGYKVPEAIRPTFGDDAPGNAAPHRAAASQPRATTQHGSATQRGPATRHFAGGLQNARTVTSLPSRESLGVVLVEDGGNWKQVLSGALAELFGAAHAPPISPRELNVPLAEPRGVWAVREGQPPTLVQLETGKVVERVPILGMHFVSAVSGDGAVFMHTEDRVVVYRGEGKDDRQEVKPGEKMEHVDWGHLTQDGCYWFVRQREGNDRMARVLGRYTGKTLELFPSVVVPQREPQIVIGTDGVLLEMTRGWTLVTPRGVISNDVLEDLIAVSPKEVTQTFTGPRPMGRPGEYRPVVLLQADSAGNVWLLRSDKAELKVFSAGKWQDAQDALIAAGNPRGGATSMVAVGKGDRVLVKDDRGERAFGAKQQKTTFLVWMADGKVMAEALPEVADLMPFANPVFDAAGMPWVESLSSPAVGRGRSVLMTAQGVGPMAPWGTVRYADSAGDLWVIHSYFGMPSDRSTRVYRGEKFAEVDIPLSPLDVLCESGEGTICCDSILGLRRMRVVEEAGRLRVAEEPTLRWGGLETRGEVDAVSRLGFAVVRPRAASGRARGQDVVIYSLGSKDEKRD